MRKEWENFKLELSTVEKEREELRKQVGQNWKRRKKSFGKPFGSCLGSCLGKNLPKEYLVEGFEGTMTFLEEADSWKKRCRRAKERSVEAESARDKIWEEVLE